MLALANLLARGRQSDEASDKSAFCPKKISRWPESTSSQLRL